MRAYVPAGAAVHEWLRGVGPTDSSATPPSSQGLLRVRAAWGPGGHTLTQAHTHALTQAHTHTLTQTYTHTLTHTPSHSPPLTQAHTHALTLPSSHKHTPTPSPSPPHLGTLSSGDSDSNTSSSSCLCNLIGWLGGGADVIVVAL